MWLVRFVQNNNLVRVTRLELLLTYISLYYVVLCNFSNAETIYKSETMILLPSKPTKLMKLYFAENNLSISFIKEIDE